MGNLKPGISKVEAQISTSLKKAFIKKIGKKSQKEVIGNLIKRFVKG